MNEFLSYGVWSPALRIPKIAKPRKKLLADSQKNIKFLKEEFVIINEFN
jgi:hypothetical protein